VSSDYQIAVTSINLGTPLVLSEPDSKIALELKRISGSLSGGPIHLEEPKPRRAIWSSFFKRAPTSPRLDFQASMEKI
jgi:MinD-like ATPase involved in chromosome partitioning or flagellar assembly